MITRVRRPYSDSEDSTKKRLAASKAALSSAPGQRSRIAVVSLLWPSARQIAANGAAPQPPYETTPKIINLIPRISEAVGSYYAHGNLRLHRIDRIRTTQGILRPLKRPTVIPSIRHAIYLLFEKRQR